MSLSSELAGFARRGGRRQQAVPLLAWLLALGSAAGAVAVRAGAQPAEGLSTEERSFRERLALAKARSALVERIYALPLTEHLTVGAWAARSVARDRALRLWLRSQPRSGAARLYSDGSCDADVRLEPKPLLEQLERLERDHPHDQDQSPGPGELQRAAAQWPIVWSTGTILASEAVRGKKPDGWEDVTTEGIEVVRRAAEADARGALLEAAADLPVTNARRLREFLDSGAAVRSAVLAGIERIADVKVSFELDQVAVATARLGIVDLIRVLTDVYQNHYQGELFHAADFREMALLARQDEVVATGLAIPPSDVLVRAKYKALELDAPAWMGTTLSAVGRYEPRDDDNLVADARTEAARLDGINRLRRQVEALVIQGDVTVAAFLAEHDELKDDVVLMLSGARLAGPARTLPGGDVEVPVELPLRRLWWIVRRGMKPIEADLPEASATQPAEKEGP